MSATLAVAWREFASYFRTPIGWAVLSLYLLLAGAVFALGSLRPGEPATLRDFFSLSNWLLLFVAPAISMRLLAEERRTGSIETLLTAPVSDWQVALGKYAGAAGFLAAMLAPTALYAAVLAAVSDPDPGPVLAGFVGLLCVGAFYLAAGTLFSALTSNQVVAFLATLFAFLTLRLASTQGAALAPEPLGGWLRAVSTDARLADFARGVVDTSHVVFFAAASAWLLTIAALAMETRRWR